MSRAPLPPINFSALAEALLRDAERLVPLWLKGGVYNKPEYACGSLSGGEGRSCSVNLVSGKWADFQAGEAGGDLLSLYAAIHNLPMAKAAAEVAREEGLEQVANIVMGASGGPPPPPRPPRPPPPPKAPSEKENWTPLKPAPAQRVEPTFWHYERKQEDIEHTARYQVGDDLYGFIVRYITSTGKKLPMPYTYCESLRDGSRAWKWRFWEDPRPLYFPGQQLPNGRTVVLVEGERKADVLHALLEAGAPGIYCVTSWAGGCKSWAKAEWSWLAGCTVIEWPDCDSHREPLTRAEARDNPDPVARAVLEQAKPYLPMKEQTGMKAMLRIGALLRDTHGCTVQLLAVEQPGVLVSGWDCRDAIETDGWDFERVMKYFSTARALLADVSAPAPAAAASGGGGGKKIDSPGGTGGSGSGGAGGDGDGDGDEFSAYLAFIADQLDIQVHQIQPNRKMIVAALRKAPALRDCLAFDELRDAPCTRKPWPWRDKAAPLVDQDDLQVGDFIEQTYKTKSASRAALAEAIELVADSRRFHPIREWLGGLQWDGKPRIEKWLMFALGHDPAQLEPKLRRYLELVGRYILLGQVYRVMEPGCKFDYSVVLEGITGMGKSTLIRALVGDDWFSDTHFDIGAGKDGMEQLAGIWAYELSEMTAFRRADSEAVKQFFTTQKDRYRGAYGRYVQDHPRQVCIWCTTNKRQYLFDITGNRRFWPVWVGSPLNVEFIRKWRGQLFAEALALYRQGARNYPTPDEERMYFVPEQEKRLVETGVQSRLYDLLTREGARDNVKGAAAISEHTTFVTVAELVVALGTDPGKSSSPLETQIRDWLMEHGWVPKREPIGQRRRGYARPDVWPPKFDDEPVPPAPPPGGGDVAGDSDHGADVAPPPWHGGGDYEPF